MLWDLSYVVPKLPGSSLTLWGFPFYSLQIKPGSLQQSLFKKSNLPYVLLVTESKELPMTAKSTRILLSSKKGYIFIQTDKPIYTPSSQG